MNKSVQILLLLALIPLSGFAREETLEERKQRIVRKYLRDRAAITQSDMTVPSELLEDERVTDSEKFKTAEVDLQRQQAPAQPVVPPPQVRQAPRTEENWLLQGTDETTELDMYGNPVSTANSETDFWAPWGSGQESQKPAETRSSSRRYDPYGRNDSSFSGRREQQQQDSRIQGFGGTSPASGTGRDIFGRQPTQPAYSSGLGTQPKTRYGSSPDEGLLNSPFSRSSSSSDSSETERSGTYQPYKSPYQQQREQRSSTWSTPSREAEQEYQRSDSYQQWKSRKKEYDPTSDDAYIDQMMRQNKR